MASSHRSSRTSSKSSRPMSSTTNHLSYQRSETHRDIHGSPSTLQEEIVNFRKHLNHREADSLDRRMDENTAHLDVLESRLQEIDSLLARRRKKSRSSKRTHQVPY
eukprot:GFKZ01014184.1.p1 GENE.GFKZ01014184.1~~GFKZ01014184.1.p1  ORF type:complete len:106 (+),score=7.17 GFKZ01014184.1:207-524(+)